MHKTDYHQPVLLHECIDAMKLTDGGVYVDLTFGGGGHSREILNRMGKDSILFAFDQDNDAVQNLPKDKRLIFIPQNFAWFSNHIRYQGFQKVNAILADLGVSSHQFDVPSRGFSFRFDDQLLDMRMDLSQQKTAASIINTYNEEQLADVLYYYGEFDNARRMAASIHSAARQQKIQSVGELKEVLKPFTPKIHDWKFLARVFQALRIEVNQEMDVLKRMLLSSADMLHAGGRMVVMSYHSLEDRLVKNYFQAGNFEGKEEKDFFGNSDRPFKPISRKPIVPSEAELEQNPRSRSVKLRIAERLA